MSLQDMNCKQLIEIKSEDRDIDWLKKMLRHAIKLEFTTIPPYLCAYWSIMDHDFGGETAIQLKHIALEEMTHMGLVANLLTAVGETPVFYENPDGTLPAFDLVPSYPGPILDGSVRGTLGDIALQKLSKDALMLFMQIELPSFADSQHQKAERENNKATETNYKTVGDFYHAIKEKVSAMTNDEFVAGNQLELVIGPEPQDKIFVIETRDRAIDAIEQIMEEGEGTESSAIAGEEFGEDGLAHFYRFKELYDGKRFNKGVDDHLADTPFTGDPIPLPAVYDSKIPIAGYVDSDFEDLPLAKERYQGFLDNYIQMLKDFDMAWSEGGASKLQESVRRMSNLTFIARDLMRIEKPDGSGNFGPYFNIRGPVA